MVQIIQPQSSWWGGGGGGSLSDFVIDKDYSQANWWNEPKAVSARKVYNKVESLQDEIDTKSTASSDSTWNEPTWKAGDIFVNADTDDIEIKSTTAWEKVAKDADTVHKSWTETITWPKTFEWNYWNVEIPTWNSTPQVHVTDTSSSTDTHYYAWSIQNTIGWVTYTYPLPTKNSTLATLADISAAWGGDVTWPSSAANNDIAVFDWTTGKVIKDSWFSAIDFDDRIATLEADIDTKATKNVDNPWQEPTWTAWDIFIDAVNDIVEIKTTSGWEEMAKKSDIPDVIDWLTSMSTTDALSANQGRILMDEIQILQSRWRYLSDWNAQTWLARTLPKSWTTYIYNAWDYFDVYNVWPSWTTHYRPDGNTYPVPAIPSITVETADVQDRDKYVYDGSQWILQHYTGWDISFANISWQPSDNSNLWAALDGKVDKVSTASKVYATNGSWSQTTLSYSTSASASSVAQRWTNGTLIVWTPTDNTHATTKKYVDDLIATKQNTLTAWTNISISGNTISATDTTYTASDFDIKDLADTTWLRTTWSGKQDALVSGTNIKTINSTSLLWNWNIAVQPTLVSWTNIKSVNGNSLLGSGNLEISWLPTQTWNNWKFLQTNWTTASWDNVNEFKTQEEYDALPATKTSDNKTYFIYEEEA